MTANEVMRHSHRHHPGLALAISGLLIAAAFASFIFMVPQGESDPYRSPLWIAVFWGALMVFYGLFRVIRGDSKLDHQHGGTNADPQ